MKYLVIGGSGVIGYKIVEFLKKNENDVEFTFKTNNELIPKGIPLDITNFESTQKIIERIKPNIVIHTAAISNVDFCETNKKMAELVNVEGTRNIVNACKKINSKIVFVSTSFVFNGKKKFIEEDETSPSTFYGITKFKGEQIVQKSKLSHLILRTDQPYCWIEKNQHTNSVLRVLQSLKENKIHEEVTDWSNVPTYVPDFVDALYELLKLKQEGIFHVTGPDYLNRFEWAKITAKIFNLNKNLIKPISSETLGLATKRVNGNLNNQKLIGVIGRRMMGVEEGLKTMYEFNKNN